MVTRDIHICLIFTFLFPSWFRGQKEEAWKSHFHTYGKPYSCDLLTRFPKNHIHRGWKKPHQRSIMCAALHLQICSPRLHHNHKWELLLPWLKKVQERSKRAAGVPEGMARAEESTTSRAHILNHTTYCPWDAKGSGFHLTEP